MNTLAVILHVCLIANGPCLDTHHPSFSTCLAQGAEWLVRAQAWAARSNLPANLGPGYSCAAQGRRIQNFTLAQTGVTQHETP